MNLTTILFHREILGHEGSETKLLLNFWLFSQASKFLSFSIRFFMRKSFRHRQILVAYPQWVETPDKPDWFLQIYGTLPLFSKSSNGGGMMIFIRNSEVIFIFFKINKINIIGSWIKLFSRLYPKTLKRPHWLFWNKPSYPLRLPKQSCVKSKNLSCIKSVCVHSYNMDFLFEILKILRGNILCRINEFNSSIKNLLI